MKNCLIVGVDKIVTTNRVLKDILGVSKIIHWNGRRARPPTCLPNVKKLADRLGISMKYAFQPKVTYKSKGGRSFCFFQPTS